MIGNQKETPLDGYAGKKSSNVHSSPPSTMLVSWTPRYLCLDALPEARAELERARDLLSPNALATGVERTQDSTRSERLDSGHPFRMP